MGVVLLFIGGQDAFEAVTLLGEQCQPALAARQAGRGVGGCGRSCLLGSLGLRLGALRFSLCLCNPLSSHGLSI